MSPGAMPPDPFTDMAVMAALLHEAFEAYMGAGFTEAQAIVLVGSMVQQLVANAKPD